MNEANMGTETPKQETNEAKDIRWVYTMSVPSEKGEPKIEIVIGVPQNSTKTGWLLPTGFNKENLNHTIEVPLNVIINGQRIECIAKGTIMGDLGGNKFRMNNIEAKESLSEENYNSIAEAYNKVLDPTENRTVISALQEAIEEQCQEYFKQERAED